MSEDILGGQTPMGATDAPFEYDAAGEQTPEEAAFDLSQVDPAALGDQGQALYRDYTQKSQEIADTRRELAEEKARLSWADNINELSKTNPAQAKEVLEFIANQLGEGEEPVAAALPPEMEFATDTERMLWDQQQATQRQLSTTLNEISSLRDNQADQVLEDALGDVRKKYGNFNEASVLKEMEVSGITDPEKAFRIVNFENAEARGVDMAQANLRGKRRATSPASQAAHNVRHEPAINSVEDAFAAAKRELGISLPV